MAFSFLSLSDQLLWQNLQWQIIIKQIIIKGSPHKRILANNNSVTNHPQKQKKIQFFFSFSVFSPKTSRLDEPIFSNIMRSWNRTKSTHENSFDKKINTDFNFILVVVVVADEFVAMGIFFSFIFVFSPSCLIRLLRTNSLMWLSNEPTYLACVFRAIYQSVCLYVVIYKQ